MMKVIRNNLIHISFAHLLVVTTSVNIFRYYLDYFSLAGMGLRDTKRQLRIL